MLYHLYVEEGLTDREIEERYGIRDSYHRREQYGIVRNEYRPTKARELTESVLYRLCVGKGMTDIEIGKAYNISPSAVAYRRQKRPLWYMSQN